MSENMPICEGKILWAVDPFCSEKSILRSAAWAIRALVKGKLCQIQPIYISANFTSEFCIDLGRATLDEIRSKGQDELDSVLSRVKVPGIQPLQVRPMTYMATREAVRELVALAKKETAEMIVISTRARKGVNRFLLGSFAETLVFYSDIPLLIVHPNWRRVPEFKKILFPTDFSDESKEAFQQVVEFAAIRKCKVVLFHKPGLPAIPSFDFAFTAAIPDYQKVYEDELKLYEAEAKELVALGKEKDVPVEIVFDRSRGGSVADAILKSSKRLNCMVALASRSGWIETIVLGSTTRQVVRYCEQLVWVIHPFLKRQNKKEGRTVEPLYTLTQKEVEQDLIEHRRKRGA